MTKIEYATKLSLNYFNKLYGIKRYQQKFLKRIILEDLLYRYVMPVAEGKLDADDIDMVCEYINEVEIQENYWYITRKGTVVKRR